MSTLHYPSPTVQQTADSLWDVPRLHKDKIYRDQERHITSLRPLIPQREGLPPGPPRVPLLELRAKSSGAIPTAKSLRIRISPTTSIDMSSSRYSLDARSLSGTLPYQPERSGNLTQGLRAKGSRLLRRQNSKFNSRNIEWIEGLENSYDRSQMQATSSKSTPRHSRIQSAGNGTPDLL